MLGQDELDCLVADRLRAERNLEEAEALLAARPAAAHRGELSRPRDDAKPNASDRTRRETRARLVRRELATESEPARDPRIPSYRSQSTCSCSSECDTHRSVLYIQLYTQLCTTVLYKVGQSQCSINAQWTSRYYSISKYP